MLQDMEKVQWNSINKWQNGLKQSKNEKSSTHYLTNLQLYDPSTTLCSLLNKIKTLIRTIVHVDF